jgi:hypothetical protein
VTEVWSDQPSTEKVAPPPKQDIGDLDHVHTDRATDVEEALRLRQEGTRERIVRSLLGLFAIVIVLGAILSGIAIWKPGANDSVATFLQVVVPSVVTLLGTVFGFYFGREATRSDRG